MDPQILIRIRTKISKIRNTVIWNNFLAWNVKFVLCKQAEELAELQQAGSQAYREGRYAEAADIFTTAINKSSNNPDYNLYKKRKVNMKLLTYICNFLWYRTSFFSSGSKANFLYASKFYIQWVIVNNR